MINKSTNRVRYIINRRKTICPFSNTPNDHKLSKLKVHKREKKIIEEQRWESCDHVMNQFAIYRQYGRTRGPLTETGVHLPPTVP
jgi:hypothetical protein